MFRPHGRVRFVIQPFDLRTRRLLPPSAIRDNGEILSGVATTREPDISGHRVYTLYLDQGKRIYLRALDTVGRRLGGVELPRLRGWNDPLLLRLHLDQSGHQLTIAARSRNQGDDRQRPVLRIDTRSWKVREAPSAAREWAMRLAAIQALARRVGSLAGELVHPRPDVPGPLGIFSRVVGHSLRGRPIEMLEVGDLSLPGRLLVFGCICWRSSQFVTATAPRRAPERIGSGSPPTRRDGSMVKLVVA